MFNRIPDHIEKGLDRLAEMYKGTRTLPGLLEAMIEPVQAIEDALGSMNTLRYLSEAFGVQLDHIGQIVGFPRPPGMGDDQYSLDILAQIKINTSEGQPEQLIQIFQLVTNAALIILDEQFPADVMLSSEIQIPNQLAANKLIELVKEAAPAGVRISALGVFDPSEAFAFAGSLPGLGFSDDTGTQGGKLATHWEYTLPFAFAGDDSGAAGFGTEGDPLVGGGLVE
jgi:hypothetical protein